MVSSFLDYARPSRGDGTLTDVNDTVTREGDTTVELRPVGAPGTERAVTAADAAEAAPVPGVLVPPDAVVQRDGAPAVFVVQDQRAEPRAIKLGGDVGKFRLATEGLKAGETVVVSPPAELKAGSPIANKD